MKKEEGEYIYEFKDDILFLKLQNSVSIDSITRMMDAMREDPNYLKNKVTRVLVDMRGIKALVTMPEDYKVVSELDRMSKESGAFSPDAKTAIVVSKLIHEWSIQLLSIVAKKQGSLYESFRDVLEACTWAGIDSTTLPGFMEHGPGWIDLG